MLLVKFELSMGVVMFSTGLFLFPSSFGREKAPHLVLANTKLDEVGREKRM